MNVIPLRPVTAPPDPHFSCPTCRDEGLPARVLWVNEDEKRAVVRTEQGEREILLDFLDGVTTGDYVLVHLEMAIAKLAPEDVVEA